MQQAKLDEDNFMGSYLCFRDRQAGISLVYDPDTDVYRYNAYCLEMKLLKELVTVEFEYLTDALAFINEEFGSWEKVEFDTKDKGCGDCAAKR